jgi:hypothetical protein
MNARFLPAGRTIEYTIEQKSTVPPETWHQFITAVINIYYLIPICFRPANPRLNNERRGAYTLFKPGLDDERDELVFSGLTGEGYRHRIITVSRERTRDVLSVDEIETEHQMSADLFTRLVMLALHNVCGEHFLVHSTAGACSWALPSALLKAPHFAEHFANWQTPEVAEYSSFFQAENARLTEQSIISNLTLCQGIDLSQAQWEDIAALEFRLYKPAYQPSREEIARLTDPNATLVDISLGTSLGGSFSHLFTQYQPLVTLRDFDALLYWVSVIMPEYESGVPDQEPVFLSRNHLAVLRDDIRNGWFSSYNNPTYAETFYAELQLVALWAEHCIQTLNFDQESAFLFARW